LSKLLHKLVARGIVVASQVRHAIACAAHLAPEQEAFGSTFLFTNFNTLKANC